MTGTEGGGDALWLLIPTGQQASGVWIDDTLKLRVEEKGLLDRTPLVGAFPRQRVEVFRGQDSFDAVQETYYRRGWTDGLPIIPPTLDRVVAMVASSGRGAKDVVATLDPLSGVATVEKVAANAVMAGCTADHFPVVLAAVEAIAERSFNLRGVQTTDENVTPLLIVSGPKARGLDINAGFGALGPGWRGSAAIGRAVRLIMNNIGGGWPGAVSFAGLGQPGRYTLCLAEDVAGTPWPSLGVENGFDNKATILATMRAESVINVTGGLDELASVMASSASNFARSHSGKVAVAVSPHTARLLAARGLRKEDAKRYLWERSGMPTEEWRASWVTNTLKSHRWPEWVTAGAERGMVPAVGSPDDITLVVAGGDVPITQHAYFPSWGFPPCCIVKEIMFDE